MSIAAAVGLLLAASPPALAGPWVPPDDAPPAPELGRPPLTPLALPPGPSVAAVAWPDDGTNPAAAHAAIARTTPPPPVVVPLPAAGIIGIWLVGGVAVLATGKKARRRAIG